MRPGTPQAPPAGTAARRCAVIAALAAGVVILLGLGGGPAQAQQPACRRFAATGQTVCGAFLQYWDAHGGLARFGWPISPAFAEVAALDGRLYQVQYFERTVLEAHPENAPPFDVLPRLPDMAAYRAAHARGPETIPDPHPEWVADTGQALGGPFRAYWDAHGGLAAFGYPLTGELSDCGPDGRCYRAQYFQFAVMQWHPENRPPYDLLLAPLGAAEFRQRYPAGAPRPAVAAAPHDPWAALAQRPLLPTGGRPGCPTTPGAFVDPAFAAALGTGPAYPVGFGTTGVYSLAGTMQEGGWRLAKVLWVGHPAYRDPVLVRGAGLGAPGVRFGVGPAPGPELRLDPAASGAAPGAWNDWPSYTRLQGPGCYAYQIDGAGFSKVIRFRAVDTGGSS